MILDSGLRKYFTTCTWTCFTSQYSKSHPEQYLSSKSISTVHIPPESTLHFDFLQILNPNLPNLQPRPPTTVQRIIIFGTLPAQN